MNRRALTTERTTPKSSAHQNQSTVNHFTKFDTSMTIPALMTKVNSPIVTIFTGSVKIISTGFKNVFKIANKIATKTAGI